MRRRSKLARALVYADYLHEQGAPRAEATVLRRLLDDYDPATGCTDWLVIKAATLYAEVAVDDPAGRLAWALFADRNSRTALGHDDLLTLHAMSTLVTVTRDQDLFVDAITACGRLADAYADLDEPVNALTWRREQAILLHRDGQCGQAHDSIAACLTQGVRERPVDREVVLPAEHVVVHAREIGPLMVELPHSIEFMSSSPE